MKAPFKYLAWLLIAAGIVMAAAVVVMPGRPLLGLDLGVAVTLVVGGCVLWALANAINLLRLVRNELRRQRPAEAPPWLRKTPTAAEAATAAPAAPEVLREQLGEQPTAAAEAQWPEPSPAESAKPAAATKRETASADAAAPTERTATESEPRAGAAPEPAAPPEEPPAPEPVQPAVSELAAELDETEESANQDAQEGAELYVVEERMFRGKPARVLSDGTIEAETDEGWMRFEDVDHLREYMDALAAMRR